MKSRSSLLAAAPAWILALSALCTAAPALAAPSAEPVEVEQHWYGHYTLFADALALSLVLVPPFTDGDPIVTLVGLGVYTVATPIIHALHGNPWWTASIGLRVSANLLLLFGAVVVFSSCPIFSDSCDQGGVVFGGGLMIAGALLGIAMPIVDAVLAVRPVPRRRASLVPLYAAERRAAGLALVGRF